MTSVASLDVLRAGLSGASFEHLLLRESLHAYYPEHERDLILQGLLGFLEKTPFTYRQ